MGAHNSVVGGDQGFRAPSWDQESVRDSVHEDSTSARIAAGQRPRPSFRHPQGRLPDHGAARDLKALASCLDENEHRLLLRAAELVGTDPPFIERLRAVASSLPGTVTTISRFVTRAEQAMSGIARDLDERRAGGLEDETLEDVASGVLAAVGRLAEAVEEFEK